MPDWVDRDDEDESEAKLFRRDAEDDARWARRCEGAVEYLLAHLTPAMARWELFTFAQQRRWWIRRH